MRRDSQSHTHLIVQFYFVLAEDALRLLPYERVFHLRGRSIRMSIRQKPSSDRPDSMSGQQEASCGQEREGDDASHNSVSGDGTEQSL